VIRLPHPHHESPAVTAKPEVPKAPTITLDNDGEASASAAKGVQRASFRLKQIDRTALAGVDASTYHQASELLNAAQKALADHDYPAASSLANKASALTNQLPVPTR
jgi:hypothetical protein